jgi:hypothetical protein
MPDDEVILHSYPPADMSADEFEQFVVDVLQQTAPEVDSLDIKLHEVVAAPDGSYDFDATVRYRLLGMDFLVLVEAKHHRHPIKREVVQVLESKIRSVGAHKGVIVSTAQFQRGALEFAKSHGVALVHVTEGRFTFVQRSASPRPAPLSREVALEMGVPVFVGYCYANGSEPNSTSVTVVSDYPEYAARLLLGTDATT